MAEKTNEVSQEIAESNGIDQIRDIIFGEQVVAWQKRFEKLEKALEELGKSVNAGFTRLEKQLGSEKQNLSGDLEQVRSELGKASDTLRAELAAANNELAEKIAALEEHKVDRDSIGEVFIQWGQKVKTKE